MPLISFNFIVPGRTKCTMLAFTLKFMVINWRHLNLTCKLSLPPPPPHQHKIYNKIWNHLLKVLTTNLHIFVQVLYHCWKLKMLHNDAICHGVYNLTTCCHTQDNILYRYSSELKILIFLLSSAFFFLFVYTLQSNKINDS